MPRKATGNPNGRPNKVVAVAAALRMIAQGTSILEACAAAGVGRSTLMRAKAARLHMAAEPDDLDVPNIGARVFRRPAVRIRSASTGADVAPERLARNLIRVAMLEHAVVDKRRSVVFCAACRGMVRVGSVCVADAGAA